MISVCVYIEKARTKIFFFGCALGGRREQKENWERTTVVGRICVF